MHVVEKSIWIDRSPDEVFIFHVNHVNRESWHQHVVHSEMITPGPIQVGSRFTIDTITAGRIYPLEIEITAFEPTRYYAYRSYAANAITDSHQTFEAEDGGTRFRLRIEINFRGFAKPFGWLILKLGLERHFAQAVREIKEEMEK